MKAGIITGILCITLPVHAQMPHEVLLLANSRSQDSLKAANIYAAARNIPFSNVVRLDIPEEAFSGRATILPEQFTQWIWNPAVQAVRKRGLEEQILAWVYSVDFPIRVRTDPDARRKMSVGGLTFLRNQLPGLVLVEEGEFLSKLFAGPSERLKLYLPGISLGRQKHGLGAQADVPPEAAWLQHGLGSRMPLPSMMLGYTGEKGNTIETVLDTIRRGRQADCRGLRNGIYFVESDDIRSTCRAWQYAFTVSALNARGITATVSTGFPVGVENVMGILCGSEKVDPSSIGSFAPGAMAEHLTSWSAEFQKPQTKCTAWLEAGATATAGAVVEPYANPAKFPAARFFEHYASGCTALESFYQSIACPLQILLLGDPLAKPYAPPVTARLLGADRIEQPFTYIATASSRIRNVRFSYTFLLDGREVQPASRKKTILIDPAKLSDGYHELRVVARVNHLVEFNALAEKSFVVDRHGRSVSISPEIKKLGTFAHAIKPVFGGEEHPKKVQLLAGASVLDEHPFRPNLRLRFDERKVGEGPCRLQLIAYYADGMAVASPPLGITVSFQ